MIAVKPKHDQIGCHAAGRKTFKPHQAQLALKRAMHSLDMLNAHKRQDDRLFPDDAGAVHQVVLAQGPAAVVCVSQVIATENSAMRNGTSGNHPKPSTGTSPVSTTTSRPMATSSQAPGPVIRAQNR